MTTIIVERAEYKIEGPVILDFRQGTSTNVEVKIPHMNDYMSIECSGLYYSKTRNNLPAPDLLVIIYLPEQGNRFVRFTLNGIKSVVYRRSKNSPIISEMISLRFMNLTKDISLHHLSIYSIELSGNKFVSIEDCEILNVLSCLNTADVYLNKVWTHDLVIDAPNAHIFLGMCRFVMAVVTCENFSFYGLGKKNSASLVLHMTKETSRVFLSKLHCNAVNVCYPASSQEQKARIFDCVIKKKLKYVFCH